MPKRAKTPPEYAEELGVKPEKIRTWIKNGDLRAINVAEHPGGRPRWMIPLEAIEDFEERRSSTPPAPKPQRKTKTTDLVEYV